MFKHLYLILVIWTLAVTSVQAKSYVRDYTYKASEADSKITSRANALDQVKLILLQEIGTHIRQEINITKDGSGNTYASEDVEAITAGLTKIEIIEEKWNGETYYLKARIDADTESVRKALAEIKKEKSKKNLDQLESLKENQKELREARDELEKLRKQLAHANNQEKEQIVTKYVKQVDQLSLSQMFVKGYSYERKGQYEDAVYWYRKAAEQGFAKAQYSLGGMYQLGRGVKRDDKLAVAWYRKSAEQGDARAQHMLGLMYNSGQGIKQDFKQAVVWFRKSAEQGYAGAQYNLGVMYRLGSGVKRNKTISKQWYEKSCNGGYMDACASI